MTPVIALYIKELKKITVKLGSYDDNGLIIKDNCWGAKIGLNINKLTE
ncbi:hypothetical protein MASR1M74_28690 [Lentimicrobium sp.]